jgi:vitamin B12 transporter
LRLVSANYDTQFFGAFATEKLPSYTTVDVAADYDLNDRVTLTGRVTNLFDDDAVDVWGYASRGRAAYIGVRANF